jgi:hypothetical protein
MVGNICLSQPRDHGRDMVVESEDLFSIVGSVKFCLLSVILLYTEELLYLGCLTCIALRVCAGYIEASN